MSRFSEESSGHDLMSKIYRDFEKNGGVTDLPGKGKPIPPEALKGDALNNVLKNANYLPPWLNSQHKIRDSILKLLREIEQGFFNEKEMEKEMEKEIKLINKEIKKYNSMCPLLLQKPSVSKNTLIKDKNRWI